MGTTKNHSHEETPAESLTIKKAKHHQTNRGETKQHGGRGLWEIPPR